MTKVIHIEQNEKLEATQENLAIPVLMIEWLHEVWLHVKKEHHDISYKYMQLYKIAFLR